MKPNILTMMIPAALLCCFVVGCDTTQEIDIRAQSQPLYDEPFEQEIRDLAVERERFYYLGKPIDQAEYNLRVDDIIRRQEQIRPLSRLDSEPKVVPIFILRF